MEIPFYRAPEGQLPLDESVGDHNSSRSHNDSSGHPTRFMTLKNKTDSHQLPGVLRSNPATMRRNPSEIFSEGNNSLSTWKLGRREKKLIAAAIEAVAEFKGQDYEAFSIEKLTGGLTNQLYLVRHTPTDHAVVVRVYGKKTEKFISRESEEFWQSVFLKTHGRVGDKILVYEFLDGYRVLDAKELLTWQIPIARKLAETHACATSAAIFTPNPLTGAAGIGSAGLNALLHAKDDDESLKQNTLPPFMFNPKSFGPINHTVAALTEWVEQVKDLDSIRKALLKERPGEDEAGDGKRRVHQFDELRWDVGSEDGAEPGSKSLPTALIKERDWLLSVIQFNISKLPTAVCHNDLLHGNIMVKEKKKATDLQRNASAIPNESAAARRYAHAIQHPQPEDGSFDMKFIDFEYTRRNYAYFDIANHFNEYAGAHCEFEHFPKRDQAEVFVREYLYHGRKVVELLRDPMNAAHTAANFQPSISEEEVSVATDLIFFFTLVSNFIWAVWSVLQATSSDIDFSYLSYAGARWQRYLDTKEEFSKAVTAGMDDAHYNAARSDSAQESVSSSQHQS